MIKKIISIFFNSITNNIFNFKGRANRQEYIIFYIVECMVFTPFLILGKNNMTPLLTTLLVICILIHIFAHTSLVVRRLHDCNINGWWFFLNILFSPLMFIVFLFKKGVDKPNRYGESPKD